MKLSILAAVFAGAAFGGTIPVTGYGTFGMDGTPESAAFVYFSGSDGVDSVSFDGDIPIGWTLPDPLAGYLTPDSAYYAAQAFMYSGGTIDGVRSSVWYLSIGDGVGNLTIFDTSGDVLASQDISGFINVTSYREDGSRFLPDGSINYDWSASGTFTIGPVNNADPAVPESGSAMLVGLGMLAALVRRFVIT